jgi:aryl-alcohol dehydrogenase-like predicted oxidoreductase
MDWGETMKYRILGKTKFNVSEISLGAWQIGGKWGSEFDENNAIKTLNSAIDLGVNFIDTADVYSNGLSEEIVSKVVQGRGEKVYVATKCGRKLNPHTADGYNTENIRKFVHESLENMELDKIDLLQLHCPPTDVYKKEEVYDALDELKREGKIVNYGVSVEKVSEALTAIENDNVSIVQIIFNMFRQKPYKELFEKARKKNVGIIVRVPLASGLLTGKFTKDTRFDENDHRFFNRSGEHFDKGETFAGIDYEKGIIAVEELKKVFGEEIPLSQIALKWILMHEAVSCVIPGSSNYNQIETNIKASEISDIENEKMDKVRKIYEKYIKDSVEDKW